MAREKVVVIEDVITGGTSLRETHSSLGLLPHAEVIGICLGIDREEKGLQDPAKAEIEALFGVEIQAILDLSHLLEALTDKPFVDGRTYIDSELRDQIAAYRSQHTP